MKKIGFLIISLSSLVFSSNILESKIFSPSNCDQILNNGGYFKTCYSYKHKGALFVGYTLDGQNMNEKNIKKRPRFYEDKNIPKKYRSKHSDYTHNKFKNDRGHLAPDAAFDYSQKSLNSVYAMSNIIPQHNTINRSSKAWKGLEKFSRTIATKLGSVYVLNGVVYSAHPNRIGRNKISVPDAYWKMIYSKKNNYQRCFYFENKKKDPELKIKDYEVDCKDL